MTTKHGEVPVLEPGQTFRYQVSDPKLGSGSSWSIKTHSKTGDVYVMHREGAKWVKSSFHASGRSHYGLSAAAMKQNPDDDPYYAIQHETVESGSGWRHAHRVTVARAELRHHQEAVSESQVVSIPMPQGFDGVSVDVYLGAPGAGITLEIHPPNQLIAVMNRGDGGSVVIMARPTELPESVAVSLHRKIGEIREEMREEGWDGQPRRISIFGLDDEGFHHEVEVVFEGPQFNARDLGAPSSISVAHAAR